MDNFIVFSATSGSAFEEYNTQAWGAPRLFEGADGMYIYRLAQRLVVTRDGWANTSEIFPSGTSVPVQAIAQILGGGVSTYTSAIFTSTTTRYQNTPETAGGWSTGGSLATGYLPIDAVGDDTGIWGVLVGNNKSTSTIKVMKGATPPFTFVESDSGLPQSGSSSAITDLEAVQ